MTYNNPSIQSTLKNQLNNSESKFQYSFPKSQRFKNQLQLEKTIHAFYDIPSTISKRAPSFGHSKKTDFAIKTEVPPPNSYSIKGDFEQSVQKQKGHKFGTSRQNAKSYSFLKIIQNPGVGTYHQNPQFTQHKITYQYSIGKYLRSKDIKSEVPGPGAYQIKSPLLDEAKVLSTYERRGTALIIPSINKRIKTEQSIPVGIIYPKISSKGDSLQFVGNRGYSIGKSKRFLDKGLMIPPPGSYQTFSEFIQSKKNLNSHK